MRQGPYSISIPMLFALLGLAMVILAGCGQDPTPDADSIYINGTILTMAKGTDSVSAISFRDGRVQAIGSQSGVMRHQGDNTQIIDLNGNTMVPGFIAANGQFTDLLNPQSTLEDVLASYARQGITTLIGNGLSAESIANLQSHAERRPLLIDVVVIPVYPEIQQILEDHGDDIGKYQQHLKITGVQFRLDNPLSKFGAWMAYSYNDLSSLPYTGWKGEPLVPFRTFLSQYRDAVSKDLQVFVEASGDAAIDAFIQAAYELKINAGQDKRHTIVLSRFMRINQLSQYRKLGVVACFDTSNIYQEGKTDIRLLGKSRADGQSPVPVALQEEVTASNLCHQLTHPPDTLFILWSAVTRHTQQNEILGSQLRTTPAQALRSMTIEPAYMIFEEDRKGTLTPGKVADAVILSGNPLSVPPGKLREIQIQETIKNGRTIFHRPPASTP
ncbi:amidohydrolase family protein [Photobacterium aquae]|nr:amidohydrolase family protein [Photobacterium aquae]